MSSIRDTQIISSIQDRIKVIEAQIGEKIVLFKDKEELVKSHLFKLCKMLSDLDTKAVNNSIVTDVQISDDDTTNKDQEVMYKIQYISVIQQFLVPSMVQDLSRDRDSMNQITSLLEDNGNSEMCSFEDLKILREEIENLEDLLVTRDEALKALDNLLKDITGVLIGDCGKEQHIEDTPDKCELSEKEGNDTAEEINVDKAKDWENDDYADEKCFTPTCILA